jgi:hypothetical protein
MRTAFAFEKPEAHPFLYPAGITAAFYGIKTELS